MTANVKRFENVCRKVIFPFKYELKGRRNQIHIIRLFLLSSDSKENSETLALIGVKIHYCALILGHGKFHFQSSFNPSCSYKIKLFLQMTVLWVVAWCILVEF
jgi:hypothetical protein